MHTPPDMSIWQGRDDTVVEGPDATRLHQCIKPWSEDSPPGVCLLGFACDEGVRRNHGRVGAAEGPTALRKALANLAWNKGALIYDAGDVRCTGLDLDFAQHRLAASIDRLLRHRQNPLVLGGGHETAWGSFLGVASMFADAVIGVINIDAHFDLRPSHHAHSGTAFRQIADWHGKRGRPYLYRCYGIAKESNTKAAFETAKKLCPLWRTDLDLVVWKYERIRADVLAFIEDVEAVYLSLDLDVLPSWIMPAVSAPAALGISIDTIQGIVDAAVASGKLAVADVVEFNPTFDRDGVSARTAARLVWRLARQMAKKRPAP